MKKPPKKAQSPPTSKSDKPKTNNVEWEVTELFKSAWLKSGKNNDAVRGAMREFDRCKRAIPVEQLPGKMAEHKLDGPFQGINDCHFADDLILLYRLLPGGAIRLLTLCTHAELFGPRSKALRKKIKTHEERFI